MHDHFRGNRNLRKADTEIRRGAQTGAAMHPLGVASNYRHYEPYPIFVKTERRQDFTMWTATIRRSNLCFRRSDGRALPSRRRESSGAEAP